MGKILSHISKLVKILKDQYLLKELQKGAVSVLTLKAIATIFKKLHF